MSYIYIFFFYEKITIDNYFYRYISVKYVFREIFNKLAKKNKQTSVKEVDCREATAPKN